MIFQNRGRPQGNIHKKGKSDFLRSPEPGRAGPGFIFKPGRVTKTGPGTILNRAGPGRVSQKTGPGQKIRAGSQKPGLRQSGPGTVHPCLSEGDGRGELEWIWGDGIISGDGQGWVDVSYIANYGNHFSLGDKSFLLHIQQLVGISGEYIWCCRPTNPH